jgi:hypothetical protein
LRAGLNYRSVGRRPAPDWRRRILLCCVFLWTTHPYRVPSTTPQRLSRALGSWPRPVRWTATAARAMGGLLARSGPKRALSSLDRRPLGLALVAGGQPDRDHVPPRGCGSGRRAVEGRPSAGRPGPKAGLEPAIWTQDSFIRCESARRCPGQRTWGRRRTHPPIAALRV